MLHYAAVLDLLYLVANVQSFVPKHKIFEDTNSALFFKKRIAHFHYFMLQSFVLSFHFLHCFVSCISLMANFSLSDASFLVSEMTSSGINGGTMSLRLGIRHYAKKEVDKE